MNWLVRNRAFKTQTSVDKIVGGEGRTENNTIDPCMQTRPHTEHRIANTAYTELTQARFFPTIGSSLFSHVFGSSLITTNPRCWLPLSLGRLPG